MLRVFALCALLALPIIAPALAAGCEPTTSRTDVDTGLGIDAAPRYYFVRDPCLDNSDHCVSWGATGIPWLYQESNGIDGLQRADDIRDDTCGGQIAGDTLRF